MSIKLPAWFRDQLKAFPIDKLTNDSYPNQTIAALENEVEQTLSVLDSSLSNYDERLDDADALATHLSSWLQWKELHQNMIGSCYTGLGLETDTLDITIYNKDKYYKNDEKMNILQLLVDTCPSEHKATLVKTTFIPYVQLQHPDRPSLICHITLQNDIAVTTCELIAMYCRLSPVCAPMVLLIKYWAREKSLDSLSSHAYTLLVIFFLQTQEMLPVLQSGADVKALGVTLTRFNVDDYDCSFCSHPQIIDTWQERLTSQGHTQPSLLTLLYRFFVMFNNFRSDRHVVSSRRGEFLSVFNKRHKWNKGETHFFPIEDPFICSHDVGSSCTVAGSKKIVAAIDEAVEMIESGEVPFTVLFPKRTEANADTETKTESHTVTYTNKK